MTAAVSEPISELAKSSETDASCPLNALSLPNHFAIGMWNKAQNLSNTDDEMVQCPGDSSSWMVKSESNKRPHFVKAAKCGGYVCDEECLAYKSTKICAHAVAVAIKTGNVQNFLKWYNSKKVSSPNLTALAEARKPKSAGKKRKGVTKKSAKKIRSVISDVDELAWQYPHSVGESQGDSSNTESDVAQPGELVPSSMSLHHRKLKYTRPKNRSHFNR